MKGKKNLITLSRYYSDFDYARQCCLCWLTIPMGGHGTVGGFKFGNWLCWLVSLALWPRETTAREWIEKYVYGAFHIKSNSPKAWGFLHRAKSLWCASVICCWSLTFFSNFYRILFSSLQISVSVLQIVISRKLLVVQKMSTRMMLFLPKYIRKFFSKIF